MNKKDFYNLLAIKAMYFKFKNIWWVDFWNMTCEEREMHPEYKTTGGYLKTVDYKTACSLMWENMTIEEKAAVKDIPNFDAEIFKEITGIVID